MRTFADFMEQALYGPVGYYSSGTAKSGQAGDYFTAPDVGPVFGRLLAEIFQEWKGRLAADDFRLVEAGPGEGRLARDILATHSFAYTAVEKSSARRAVLEKIRHTYPSFSVQSTLSEVQPFAGILFGNELIDAFPVHRIRSSNGRLQELLFEEKNGRQKFVWGNPTTPELEHYFRRLKIELPEAYETEVNLSQREWLKEAARALKRGLLVLIDYGRPAHLYYAPERARGTLRAFSKHKVSADFLDPSSMVDLTADVDFTSLALDAKEAGFEPLGFFEMGTFLMAGVPALEKAQEAESLRFRAALKYLLHPDGMGTAFHVLVLGKNVPGWTLEHNRLGRLGLPDA